MINPSEASEAFDHAGSEIISLEALREAHDMDLSGQLFNPPEHLESLFRDLAVL